MTRGRTIAVAVVALGALSGCNHVSSDSPGVSLTNAADALNSVSGYHLLYTSAPVNGHPTTVDLDVKVPGDATGKWTVGGQTADVIFHNHIVYARGAKFEANVFPPNIVAAIGTKWFQLPPETDPRALFNFFTSPSQIGKCLTGDHGTVKRSGTGTVDGQAVVTITDKGDAPKTAPMVFSIASSGAPYPIEEHQTGDPNGNAPSDGCHPGRDTTVKLSKFGESVSVTAPKGAVDISKLPQG